MRSVPGATSSATIEPGHWPACRSAILDWLVNETTDERFIDNIFVTLCERLRDAGIPAARGMLSVRTQNPEWLGARMVWKKGSRTAEITTFDYDVMRSPIYLNSPIREMDDGARHVRQRLDGPQGEPYRYPLYDELRSEGMTDYVAWPLRFTLGKQHFVSFAADRPGGFSESDIEYVRDLLPALALVSEIRIKNRLARTLLETYVGPHASEKILAGATTRGSGATVGAAIMVCDLRAFTAISEQWPRDHVIGLLNRYFDAMSEPIERNGGEILKFMGDGLLAIFPLANPTACSDLLRAIDGAQDRMARLNDERAQTRQEPLGYGVGVHVGDVMYGNIGSRKRLDFTVIGPAVNVASRLESLTKQLNQRVLMSKSFVDLAGCGHALENLGSYPLRGLGEPIEVFTLPGGK